MTPAELLERVAVRLETTGWQRGHFGGPDGPNCMSAAISLECPGELDPVAARLRMEARLALQAVMNGHTIVGWNDAVCRDQAEAVATARRAAERLAGGTAS